MLTWSPEVVISALISLAALAERWASSRTSWATTAKPLPASPARAASTPAFRASRFVWQGDVVDDADDVADLARGLLDLLHGGDGLADNIAGALGTETRTLDQMADIFGALGAVADRRRDLFESCGGFLNGSSLLFGAAREVVGCRADFAGAGIDRRGIAANRRECRLKLFSGVVEVVSQAVEVSGEGRRDPACDIAVGEVRKTARQTVDRKADLGCLAGLLLVGELALALGLVAHAVRLAVERRCFSIAASLKTSTDFAIRPTSSPRSSAGTSISVAASCQTAHGDGHADDRLRDGT